jgi:hypothetical protein
LRRVAAQLPFLVSCNDADGGRAINPTTPMLSLFHVVRTFPTRPAKKELRMQSDLISSIGELEEAARTTLSSSAYRQIRELRVRATAAGLIVEGKVHSFYHKQLAQELLREQAVANGMRVVNRVEVDGEFGSD